VILAAETSARRHAAYANAKAGSVRAARQLVEALIDPAAIGKLQALLPDSRAVLAAVHAHEADGINRIPTVMAQVLSEYLGLTAETSIVQVNRVGHTGATGYHRLAFPALFDGYVEADRKYVLVDDFIGQGGTLANFKGLIESRGGVAVRAITLTGKPYSAKLAPSDETLSRLRDKHGADLESWWERAFGYGFDRLTESEARYLVRVDNPQLIRDRILAARQEGDAR